MTSPELVKKQRAGFRITGPDGPVDFRPRWRGDVRPWRLRGQMSQPRYKAEECQAVRRTV